jgi:hypothetical protein
MASSCSGVSGVKGRLVVLFAKSAPITIVISRIGGYLLFELYPAFAIFVALGVIKQLCCENHAMGLH